jgi:sulfhydrogenase subunit delta
VGAKPRAGFYNFSGCSGCLLTILNCEDNILDVFGAAQVVSFLMANRGNVDEAWHGPQPRNRRQPPAIELDVAFIDGSVTTREQQEFLTELRQRSRLIVALGVCACYGGVQAMENGRGGYGRRYRRVYGEAAPAVVEPFESQPLDASVKVDYYIPGCPIDGRVFLHAYARIVRGLPPELPRVPVCTECKWRENECLLLKGELCLGPVTAAGCMARCPTSSTGCIGCFGPADERNLGSEFDLLRSKRFPAETIERRLRIFGGARFAETFRKLARK